ncbi:MAG: HTTM domain-containing protein [Kofleriaceae bacterium]
MTARPSGAIARWWFAPAPAERLAALRICLGLYAFGYVVSRFGELVSIARLAPAHFRPIGVARVLDAPLPPGVAIAIAAATAALLAAFVLGIRFRIVAPLAAAALLWTTSYRNSWGMVFHTENLMVLHVIALACAPAADAWSLDARRRPVIDPPAAGYGWAIKLLVALTAATYVLAGVAKLRIAGFGWIDGELLRNQIAIDNLRKALLGDGIAPLAIPFLDHPSGFTVFCVMTLAIELGAPVALLGGRIARLWALGAMGFHLGVVLLMNIWFPYPLFGIAMLPIVAVERPFEWALRRWRARRRG